MNIYEAFGVDFVDAAKTFPLSETASITLMPTSGEASKRAFEKLMEPYSVRLNAGGKLTDAENKALNAKFFANHIIKGWSGITDADGQEIDFTPERAEALLQEKKLERFFLLIVKIANDEDSFKAAREENDLGNSSPTSNGPENQ